MLQFPVVMKAVLNPRLRILIIICQSIKNKKPELQTIVDTAKADIILECEYWLFPDIANSEIFPEDTVVVLAVPIYTLVHLLCE